MRIAMTGVSGSGKSTLVNWLHSPEGPPQTRGRPICPVGSRSTAKAMGFVDPETGEGRPYDVDKTPWWVYAYALGLPNSGELGRLALWEGLERATAEQRRGAARAFSTNPGWMSREVQPDESMRPFFQRKLAEDKIAWESNSLETQLVPIGSARLPGFLTDRTPLDDVAYAILHCPEVATKAFIDRAIAHTQTYDLVVFCPLSSFQAINNDAARVSDPDYHLRYEIVLRGLLEVSEREFITLHTPDLEKRKEVLAMYVAKLGR